MIDKRKILGLVLGQTDESEETEKLERNKKEEFIVVDLSGLVEEEKNIIGKEEDVSVVIEKLVNTADLLYEKQKQMDEEIEKTKKKLIEVIKAVNTISSVSGKRFADIEDKIESVKKVNTSDFVNKKDIEQIVGRLVDGLVEIVNEEISKIRKDVKEQIENVKEDVKKDVMNIVRQEIGQMAKVIKEMAEVVENIKEAYTQIELNVEEKTKEAKETKEKKEKREEEKEDRYIQNIIEEEEEEENNQKVVVIDDSIQPRR